MFRTYLAAGSALALIALGFGALVVIEQVEPAGANGPTPTVTVTTPGQTVTRQAPRRPARVIRETETATVTATPGPAPTVTVTVPGPTVTVTHTVTAPPAETPEAIGGGGKAVGSAVVVPPTAPFVLHADTSVSAGWKVRQAARIWNDLLGCRVFTFTPNGDPDQLIYHVTETPDLAMPDGQKVWALHTERPALLQFDPAYGVARFVTMHELGHVLDLHHNERPRSLMNTSIDSRELPSKADVAEALANQIDFGRCAA